MSDSPKALDPTRVPVDSRRRAKCLLYEKPIEGETSIKTMLTRMSVDVVTCVSVPDVISKAYSESPSLIVLDVEMPVLSGYQCARVIKSDHNLGFIPVILAGPGESDIDRYWSTASGADHYLQRPVSEAELREAVHGLMRIRKIKAGFVSPAVVAPSFPDETSVIRLANNILEEKLFHAELINELYRLDSSAVTIDELITYVMSVLSSLYDFTLAAVFFSKGAEGEFYFYKNESSGDERLNEVKDSVLSYMAEKRKVSFPKAGIRKTVIHGGTAKEFTAGANELYIHGAAAASSHCVVAFDNIGINDLRDEEHGMLLLVIEIARSLLERRFLFNYSMRLSLIDAFEDRPSMAFLLSCIGKAMEDAQGQGAQVSLFTIGVADFDSICKRLSEGETALLLQFINNLIINSVTRSHIVARVDRAVYAFLAWRSGAGQAETMQKSIGAYMARNIGRYLGSINASIEGLRLTRGLVEFDPAIHSNPALFLDNAWPPKSLGKERGFVDNGLRQ